MSDTDDVNALLEQSYVYQNNTTGAVSPAPLTTRQLCRVLCPAAGVVLNHVTPDTQVLQVLDNGTYDETWKPADTVPVLQEACALWHVVVQGGTREYSCRDLAEMLEREEITKETKVWSVDMKEWSSIEELPHLMAALEAFSVQQHAPDVKAGASYDDSAMTFDAKPNGQAKEVQDELEAFLHSTAGMGPRHFEDDDDEIVEGYESDGGTHYVKDPRTGNWIHEALAPPPATNSSSNNKKRPAEAKTTTTKKRKKPKFSAKNAKCWIYVQNLPLDTTEEEVSKFFSKVGIIELDPETQRPKIKLYRHKDGPTAGTLKGDASICYARPESVELALQLLDEAPYRPSDESSSPAVVSVTRAKFEQHGNVFEKKAPVSIAKRKVAKLAALQAIGWDEGENGRITGGRKGLRIIVLKHMFVLSDLSKNEDAFLSKLEQDVHMECEKLGVVEKLTIFSKHAEGVIIVKFAQPTVASTAVSEWDGREWHGRRVEAIFWDGVTDYTVRDEEKEKKETAKRQEEFGKWLDSQELPEELRLQVDKSS